MSAAQERANNYARRGLDYDRGVVIRQDRTSGIEIFMYADEPGIYYDVHGRRVKAEIARKAGYNVDVHQKQRAHRAQMRKFTESLSEVERLDLGLIDKIVVKEKGGLKLIALSMGRALVEGPDGKALCKPSSREAIEAAFEAMTDDDFSEEDVIEAQPFKEEDGSGSSGKNRKVAP